MLNCTVLTNSDLILDYGDLLQKAGVSEKQKGPENQIAASLEYAETELKKVWYWHFQILTVLLNFCFGLKCLTCIIVEGGY